VTLEAKNEEFHPVLKQHPDASRMIEQLRRMAGDLHRSSLVAAPGKIRIMANFPRREVLVSVTSHYYISDRN
jgi:uncharacterized protein with von Willebrand factor type A (vWA) domain